MRVRRWSGAGLRNVRARILHIREVRLRIRAARAVAADTPAHHHIPAGLLRFRTTRGRLQVAAVIAVVVVAVVAAAATTSTNDRALVTPRSRSEATPYRPSCQRRATRSTSLAVSEQGGRSPAAIRPRSSSGPTPLSAAISRRFDLGARPISFRVIYGSSISSSSRRLSGRDLPVSWRTSAGRVFGRRQNRHSRPFYVC
jgi:hypothetical protein